MPANTTVDLTIQSTDVIHRWWVPSLGGKVDAVPGYTTYTWFKAPHAGSVYRGQCAQLCGRQHCAMIALVKVVTPQQYSAWLEYQRDAIATANDSQVRAASDPDAERKPSRKRRAMATTDSGDPTGTRSSLAARGRHARARPSAGSTG